MCGLQARLQCTKHSKHFSQLGEKGTSCSDDGKPDTRPPVLVTASVDAIQLRKKLAIETDMIIEGQVVWTGASSMDIRMELLQVCLIPLLAHLAHLEFCPKSLLPSMHVPCCGQECTCSTYAITGNTLCLTVAQNQVRDVTTLSAGRKQ